MRSSLFDFWQIKADHKIHPADGPVFERVGLKGHGLDLRCLPGPMRGRLKEARVVLLFLSPGLDERDIKEADTPMEQERYTRIRSGLLAYSDETPGYKWFQSRTRFLANAGIDRKRIDEDVAVLNIGAYHSKKFKDYPLLAALPSSRVALEWAQNWLFPEAERGKKAVICMRSAHFWGLERGRHWGSLFAPAVTMGGHLISKNAKDRDMNKRIVEAVGKLLR